MITIPEFPATGQPRTLPVAARSKERVRATPSAIIWLWLQRVEQRRRLARLSDHLLCDVGISREAALDEASKWFWQD